MNEFLEITASAGKRPTVKGVAYSGGKMRLFGWSRPVVVDMTGLSVPESVPLLANHENHTLGRVGVVAAKAEKGSVLVGAGDACLLGEVAGQDDAAGDVIHRVSIHGGFLLFFFFQGFGVSLTL